MAQLGARFHGMEEVESSNLSRSTKHFYGNELSANFFTDASTSSFPMADSMPPP